MVGVNFVLCGFTRRTVVAAALLGATLLVAIGCTGQPEIREVEVTREVPVTQEVPVTVETVRTVEVTRDVLVPQEIPATVMVRQTVEVTRMVEIPQTVEVTREVPVTRIAVVTPTLPVVLTPSPADHPTTTPAPTTIPTVSVTPTPMSPQTSSFINWETEYKHYGDREIFLFRNTALDYSAGGQAPVITYQCDTRAGRAMYINWHHPIAVRSSHFPSSSNDPFSQYRDIPLYALLEYADALLEFMDDLRLSDREQRDADTIWDQVTDRWFLGDDPTPGDLVELLSSRTHRSVDIDLDIFSEIIKPDKRTPYGPPSLDTISATWLVLSDRTQINQGSLGELRAAIRRAYSHPFDTGDTRPVMTATIKGPDQPAIIVAKWDIEGIRQILSHCEVVRQ